MPDTNKFSQNNNPLFGNISIAEFLTDYWQKKPLLIRQAIPNYQSPISPQELASLACQEDVEEENVTVLLELTLKDLTSDGKISKEDFADRAELLR